MNNQVQLESKLIQLQTDARALRDLIAAGAGDAAAGDELAPVLLQASSFNNSGTLPLQLDIPFSALEVNTTRGEQMAQLDALLTTIQARRAALSGENKTALYTELSAVQQQLEQAQAKTRTLQAERELAWNIYQLLLTKAGETGIVDGNQNQLVRVASAALVPATPTDSRLLIKTVLGALAGLVAGAAVALFIRAN